MASLVLVCFLCFGVVFAKVTSGQTVDHNKIVSATDSSMVKVLDANGQEINVNKLFNKAEFVKLEEIPSYVGNAFIATEDKRFYQHNGVDYRRMIGALVNNVKNGKFSQGASTISQQLIKNTHLTQEKTLNRKMKEIKLAYMLERKYSKPEILEMYLNNIYFGNGCYGIGEASSYYFNKEAKDLTLGESALLAAVINAPSVYDPIDKKESAEKRKQLVLKLMLNQGFITEDEFQKTAKMQENIVKNTKNNAKSQLKYVLDEAKQILKVSDVQLKNMSIKIYTDIDLDLQNEVENLLKNSNLIPNTINKNMPLAGVIVVDNESNKIVSLASNSSFSLLKNKRQPGSTIKPIMVYAPALEYGNIYADSVILDEKITINGYSPTNANKTYLGNVNLRECVQKSLNVPAVKVLSKVGIEKAKNFASNLGIEFENEDQNLALALGGMTKGVSLKQLADAFCSLANNGAYKQSSFIKKIEDSNGSILYVNNQKPKQVCSSATASIMTDILKGVTTDGTARRLNVFDFDIASKTGTVGSTVSNFNTDAYNVCYTTKHTIISWIGAESQDLLPSTVNGASYPTEISKNILKYLYKDRAPSNFELSEDVVEREIDTRSLAQNKVELAGDNTLGKYKKKALFNINILPEQSKNNQAHKTTLEVYMSEGQKPLFSFETKKENIYELVRTNIKTKEQVVVYKVAGLGNICSFKDVKTSTGDIYEYKVVSSYQGVFEEVETSNVIKLMSY